MVDYKINNIYTGGTSSLEPSYGMGLNKLAITTLPTVEIIKEVSDKLNMGVKNIEVEALDPKTIDKIPEEHFKEAGQVSKLIGANLSFHGPLVEASGVGEGGFSEPTRQAIERQVESTIERIHKANPKNPVITFHTSNRFPSSDVYTKDNPEGDKIQESAIIINAESGRPDLLSLEGSSFPGEDKGKTFQKELEKRNKQNWIENLRQINYYASIGEDDLRKSRATKLISDAELEAGEKLYPEQQQLRNVFERGKLYLEGSYGGLKQLFDTAQKYGTEEDKKKINEFYARITPKIEKMNNEPHYVRNVNITKEIIDEGTNLLSNISPPQVFQNADDFMMKKSSETFGNVAFDSYKKFKDEAPIIVLENPPAGQQFSRGEDVRKMVEASRKQFIENAKREGISESEAKRNAEKLIGATWDVGHINMLRKFGYDTDEILKETEKVKPVVKHMHLSDNFGLEHTELPMGMGNVPLNEIMQKLGKQGVESEKVVEAAAWWIEHKKNPLVPSLEGLNSPIYNTEGSPGWNQLVGTPEYSGGFGLMLPQTHHNLYGAGFSQLPMELGGSIQGDGGRLSGKPME